MGQNNVGSKVGCGKDRMADDTAVSGGRYFIASSASKVDLDVAGEQCLDPLEVLSDFAFGHVGGPQAGRFCDNSVIAGKAVIACATAR